jgi:hypothetical protein
MRTELTKVNLLTTSSKSSLLLEGGVIKAKGLNPIRLNDLISLDIRNHQAEVVQVVTIGTTTPTITASTRYIIKVGNTSKKNEGAQDNYRTYAYTSPATLSGNAATDRSNVYVALAALINGDSSADWTAIANVGGAGVSMTITDKAGYYKNGRKGASSVFLAKNSEGTGFVQATHLTITTAPVYAFGIGADLLAQAPVIDPLTGNVIDTSQELVKESLKNAVSGQNYSAFFFTSLVRGNVMTGVDGEVYIRHNQVLFVDNGTGSSTTNATGYAATLKEAEKIVYGQFSSDLNSIVDFFQAPGLLTSSLGVGLSTGTAGDENIYRDSEAEIFHHVIGTQTILAPVFTSTGLNISQDLTDNDGVEYSASVLANGKGSYIVGESAFSLRVKFTIKDVSGTDDCAIGFRKKEAYQANIDDYDEMACLNVISGDIKIETILNNAATTTTDTTNNWADTETHTLEVRVDESGAVTYKIDDVNPLVTAAFSFDAGEEVIPFLYFLHASDVAEETMLKEFISVPAVVNRTL